MPIHLVLDDGVGGPTAMDIVDESGALTSAAAGPQTPGNGSTASTPRTRRRRPCD